MTTDKKPAPPGATPAAAPTGKLNLKFGSPSAVAKETKKKWMLVGGAAAILTILIGSLMSSNPEPKVRSPSAKDFMDVTPKSVTEKSWQVQAQGDVQNLAKRLEELEAKNRALEEKAARPASGPSSGGNVFPALPKAGGNPFSSAEFSGALPPPPPPPPVRKDTNAPDLASIPDLVPVESGPIELTPPPLKSGSASLGDEFDEGPEVKADITYKENQFAGYLPPGSFASVTLLHGLDAATSQASRSNPQPVLMYIQRNAVLPNHAKYQLKSCSVLASGYGDLSAERAYFRLAQLSCVDKQNNLVLSAPVQGYVVDSDGKLGLRGKVVDRQGAKLAKATLAGFAQGLTGVLGMAQGTISTGTLGTTSTIGGMDLVKGAGLQGAASSTKTLADFFMKEAEAIFPVVTVDIGRTGTIVFTDGASLRWNSTSTTFVKDVKTTSK